MSRVLERRLARLIERLEEEDDAGRKTPKDLSVDAKEIWQALRGASLRDRHLARDVLSFAVDTLGTFKYTREQKLVGKIRDKMD